MKTILITGCSSGFGLEIARFFLDKGWRVVATMRTPRNDILPASDNLKVLALDVRDAESIRAAVEAAGPIDVLVNNAGIGWMNVVEGTPMETVRDIFETNTFGTIAVTQAVLPQFRERRAGVIVNVTSSVTLKPLPLLSAYTASKAAVNAFTESMALELEPFNVRVRVVLPGRSPQTSFGDTARARLQGQGGFPAPYSDFAAGILAPRAQPSDAPVTHSADVVAAVWQAATDAASPMRIPAGADAVALAG
ncbi:SDR family oxidoreductase [Pseudorhizobium pelagicum]|uniref:Dehydrogenase n=1 Tax=Pseudorhizobium pelagicum TaxID=1509405 RepID=A0A922NXB4_9HYPH|nr:SDR family oxidoreductase [Pseudorhizobium pelagicum]KEQ03446.1 dehydrogenase [Pseudorhizobium pelagicum]KEQ03980.1 dehydrogenase [Pseudorhizobium pelagicum]